MQRILKCIGREKTFLNELSTLINEKDFSCQRMKIMFAKKALYGLKQARAWYSNWYLQQEGFKKGNVDKIKIVFIN
jgi:hypothetical protein